MGRADPFAKRRKNETPRQLNFRSSLRRLDRHQNPEKTTVSQRWRGASAKVESKGGMTAVVEGGKRGTWAALSLSVAKLCTLTRFSIIKGAPAEDL